ncbi:hypothetical protein FRB97_006051 [Tulasnella sp. 331]|nr:hypothetical protein FRB97_006051 [Tulasnella sp. 331]
MSRALESTGRPIIYAMCNWGEDASWEWASDIVHCSVARVLEWAAPLSQYGGREQGGWNDLDMLEVGNGNMTYDEYVTHFSLWAILKSPLILGSNLPNMTPDELSIVTNREIIRINKDPLGVSARLRWKRDLKTGGDLQLWAGPLENNGHVVALLNNSPGPLNITFTLGDILAASPLQKGPEMVWQMLDLWSPREPASHKGPSVFLRSSEDISVALRSHQTQVWRVKPVSPLQLGSTS